MSATLAIWDHAICLRDPRITSEDEIPKELAGWAHWSQKLSGCLFSLSRQNFWRLKNAYGDRISITQGNYRLPPFKERVAAMQAMAKEAELIKSGVVLDRHDDGYSFKVPPLGQYQEIASRLLTFVDRVPLFADCGLGKSYSVLTAAERRMSLLNVMPGRVLVCGKLMTLAGWVDDCKRFTNLKPVTLWIGPTKHRKEKLIELLNSPGDIFLINHEGVRVLKEALTLKRFQGVVVDESTVLKNFHGMRSLKGGAFGKALMEVAQFAHWRAVLTGTPAPNDASELWGQFHYVDPDGVFLESAWSDFRSTFMDCIHFGSKSQAASADVEDADDDGGGKKKHDPVKWFTPKSSAEQISKIIAPLAMRVKLRDCITLPEKTVLKRVCEMCPEQAKHYANMKKDLVTVINDARISVAVKLAQIAKLRTITGGFLLDEAENAHAIPDTPKFEMMDGLIYDEIEPDQKIVVFGQYRYEISELEKRYKHLGCLSVYGGNSSVTNMANIKQFKEDPAIRLIILHPASCAHGITLTESAYCIFYSLSFSAEQAYQSVARIERASQKQPMFVFHLILKGTIDQVLFDVVHQKLGRQQELIDVQRTIDTTILDKALL